MILVEYSAYKSILLQEYTHRSELVRAVHELKLLSQRITYALGDMEEMAKDKHPNLNLEEFVLNRHKSYASDHDHPFTLIDPYVNHIKLRIYLDLYPGLDEMECPTGMDETETG